MADDESIVTLPNQFQQTFTEVNDNFTQTEIVSDEEFNAFRNGNFGIKRGRIHFTRALRWCIAHFVVSLIMTAFTIACMVILFSISDRYEIDYHSDVSITDAFITISLLCCVLGITTSVFSCYFVRYISTIRRPLFFLYLIRLLAFLECISVTIWLVLTISVAAFAKRPDPMVLFPNESDGGNYEPFLALSVSLLFLMFFDWITASAWLFHWWKFCKCSHDLNSMCIFEPGEPLALGVSDPPNCLSEFWHVLCSLCSVIYRSTQGWSFI